MAINIHQLIAAISPEVYCVRDRQHAVASVLSGNSGAIKASGYLEAASVAKVVPSNQGEIPDNPFTLEALKAPVTGLTFVRDNVGESLEAFYFRLINQFRDNPSWHVSKLLDSFEPSPGASGGVRGTASAAREQAEAIINGSSSVAN